MFFPSRSPISSSARSHRGRSYGYRPFVDGGLLPDRHAFPDRGVETDIGDDVVGVVRFGKEESTAHLSEDLILADDHRLRSGGNFQEMHEGCFTFENIEPEPMFAVEEVPQLLSPPVYQDLDPVAGLKKDHAGKDIGSFLEKGCFVLKPEKAENLLAVFTVICGRHRDVGKKCAGHRYFLQISVEGTPDIQAFCISVLPITARRISALRAWSGIVVFSSSRSVFRRSTMLSTQGRFSSR